MPQKREMCRARALCLGSPQWVARILRIGSHPPVSQKQKGLAMQVLFVFGGDSWNRTNDLMHVKHAL